MKHIPCIILAASLACMLAACGSNSVPIDSIGPDSGEAGEIQNDETQSATEPAEITSLNFFAKKDEMNIYGTLYLPAEQTESMPAVILSHSAALTSDSMQAYCKEFAQRGYAAYAFDFCGGSSSSRSDGTEEEMTIFTEVADLKAVISAIKSLDYINEDQIYLFGTSQGGLVSALTANDCADEIAGLILLYPAFNIPELAKQSSLWSGMLGNFDFSSIIESFGGTNFPLPNNGEAYIQTLLDYDAYEHIGNYKGNVLILHGSKDFIVSSSYSKKAAEIYEQCELHIIEGAGHGFNADNYSMTGDFDETVWLHIDAFLNK